MAHSAWRERILPLLTFPGLLAVAFVVEQGYLRPLVDSRPAEESVAYWESHVALHPDFAPSHVGLGQAYEAEGDLDSARHAYEQALECDLHSEPAAIGLNGVLRRAQGPTAAVAQMERFLEDNADCQACRQNLAADYLALGQLDRARSYIEQVLAKDSYVTKLHYGTTDFGADAHVLAGRIYAALGDVDRAIEQVDVAVARNRNNPAAQFQAARLKSGRDPEAAARHWEAYQQLAPQDLRPYVLRARSRLEAGHLDEAIAILREGRELARSLPDDAYTRRWRTEIDYHLALVSYRKGDLESAERGLRTLVGSHPDLSRAQELLAQVRAARNGSVQ